LFAIERDERLLRRGGACEKRRQNEREAGMLEANEAKFRKGLRHVVA
jgi:hypothetical protein